MGIKPFDVVYIGSGPSTVFSVLTLIRNHFKGNICILEKGNPIETRSKDEVISGFAGAGCWSDSKLSSSLDVGGVIPGLTQKEYSAFEKYLLDTYNIFKSKTSNKEILVWDTTEPFDTGDTGLEWNSHNTCHIGTENGQAIYKVMENFIAAQPNIRFGFQSNVVDIDFYNNNYIIYLSDNSLVFGKRVVLATGQKDTLAAKLISKFNLKSHPRPFQLGIRVEDKDNKDYDRLIKANYDFKLTKDNQFGDVHTHTRTFCCNSGNAHVCAERTDEGFIAFNGHAYKTPDPTNKTVNYGIMVEADELGNYDSKESQVELMQKINALPYWKTDNFGGSNISNYPFPSRKLLDGFDFLRGIYPDEILDSLESFIKSFCRIVDLSQAYYYYPEVKLSGMIPDINYETFETKQHGLYMIGDCLITRGIVKSSYTGYKIALALLKEKLK